GGGEGDDACAKNPRRVGCADMGDLPSSDGISRISPNIGFTFENIMGDGAACPADTTISVMGQSINLGMMTQACDFIQRYVRPLVVLLSTLAALMIAAGVLRTD
ncbi:MAG: virulence factor TspB C-terminal domain-related protein, partial [Pseudomonadota bacterium]|nr:virulence factor TspB C-terminal domain-related protein [Pseudomonadota bacterium]